MEGKNKDMTQAFGQMPEEAKGDMRELSDDELEYVVGGIYVGDLRPSDDAPIVKPILDPFE